jgi:hypothetical protein
MDNTIPYVNMEGKENLAKNRPPICSQNVLIIVE